jgi:hypothetical protein
MAKEPIIAKDALGNILAIGDEVLTITGTHDPFSKGKITKFTPKMADMKRSSKSGGYLYSMRQFHYQLIKVSTLESDEKMLGDFFDSISDNLLKSVDKEEAIINFLLRRAENKK